MTNDGVLHLHAVEEEVGEGSNEEHDVAPEPGGVDLAAAVADGAVGVGGDAVRVGEEEQAGQAPGHGGVNEARLDGGDGDVALEEAVAKALEEDVEGGLGGAVDVVALASAVAGHGCDGADEAAAVLREFVG